MFWWIQPKSEALGIALGLIEGGLLFGITCGLCNLIFG